jgi:acyl-CoA dehydrogenase
MDLETYTLPPSDYFEEEHAIFRGAFRKFCETEVVPNQARWEKQGIVDRATWKKAGAMGFLVPQAEEKHGGSGVDFRYAVIILEEMARIHESGLMIPLHNDVIAPYLLAFGSEEQKDRFVPGCVSGDTVLAVAMTEPGAGSDLAAIRTTAIRDGDHYVVNGQKTFISNGVLCGLAVVAVKTDPKADPPHAGVSLLLIEDGTPGFHHDRRLEKIGMHSQDTAEMFFEDCRVPVGNLLGSEGAGFYMMMQKLQQERLVCAIGAQAGAERALDVTIKYCHERSAFGRPIVKFQNTRFKLVDLLTQVQVGRAFIDRLVRDHLAGREIIKETCMAKAFCTEMFKRVADECLQFFGGYGYMTEYPIAKAFTDARVQMIFAGTNEIMKEIVAKQLGW